MFEHLFQGSPPRLLAMAELGLILHIGAASVAIASGAATLWVRKGARAHRLFGNVFFFAMLTMCVMAASLAAVLVARGHPSQSVNVIAAVFTAYLVATGWTTARRQAGTVGCFEIGAMGVALGLAAVGLLALATIASGKATGSSDVPVFAPVTLTVVASLAAAMDLKVILRGGARGAQRTARHLWRMCFGLFIATASFFLGQQKIMPAFVRGSPVLLALGFAPLILMAFWLVRVRFAGAVSFAQRLARGFGARDIRPPNPSTELIGPLAPVETFDEGKEVAPGFLLGRRRLRGHADLDVVTRFALPRIVLPD
ncbi:MAG: hypothetical protein ACREEB_13530 [Caulobacteraceae bacterium]